MEHFVKVAKPNKERPVLMLLDNHDSHLSVRVLKYANENGVVMLSFPRTVATNCINFGLSARFSVR